MNHDKIKNLVLVHVVLFLGVNHIEYLLACIHIHIYTSYIYIYTWIPQSHTSQIWKNISPSKNAGQQKSPTNRQKFNHYQTDKPMNLVGGFNPFQEYACQIGSFPQLGGKQTKMVETNLKTSNPNKITLWDASRRFHLRFFRSSGWNPPNLEEPIKSPSFNRIYIDWNDWNFPLPC